MGAEKACRLSESAEDLAQAGEFRHAPTPSTTRRIMRDTGVFFWLLFCHAEEK